MQIPGDLQPLARNGGIARLLRQALHFARPDRDASLQVAAEREQLAALLAQIVQDLGECRRQLRHFITARRHFDARDLIASDGGSRAGQILEAVGQMPCPERAEQRHCSAKTDRYPQNTNGEPIGALIHEFLWLAELHRPGVGYARRVQAHGSAGHQNDIAVRQPLESRSDEMLGRRFDGRRLIEQNAVPRPIAQRVRSDRDDAGAIQDQRLRRAAAVQGIAQTLHIRRRPRPVQMCRDHPDYAAGGIAQRRREVAEQRRAV